MIIIVAIFIHALTLMSASTYSQASMPAVWLSMAFSPKRCSALPSALFHQHRTMSCWQNRRMV
jgi:hypothetical protein